MGWPATLTVGMVSGVAGLALALLVGDAVAKAHRVSSFEGASGYLVVFVCGPLGFLAGLGVGIAIALLSEGAGVGGFLKVQALALAATGFAIGGVGGIAVLVADKSPTIDGQLLMLEVEIRTPATVGIVEELKAGGFRPSVSEGRSSQSADVRFEEATTRDGQFVIPATASLYAHSSDRAFLIARRREPSARLRAPHAGEADEGGRDMVSVAEGAHPTERVGAERGDFGADVRDTLSRRTEEAGMTAALCNLALNRDKPH